MQNGSNKGLEDKHRSGRPISKTTLDDIDKIRGLIEEDPYIPYEQLSTTTTLSNE